MFNRMILGIALLCSAVAPAMAQYERIDVPYGSPIWQPSLHKLASFAKRCILERNPTKINECFVMATQMAILRGKIDGGVVAYRGPDRMNLKWEKYDDIRGSNAVLDQLQIEFSSKFPTRVR